MKDATTNLNREKQGFKFLENTQAFAQTLKIYEGRWIYDMFSFNFVEPIVSAFCPPFLERINKNVHNGF
jgi:hypothetical protein